MITTYLPDGHIQTGSFALEEPTALEQERRHAMEKGAWHTIKSCQLVFMVVLYASANVIGLYVRWRIKLQMLN